MYKKYKVELILKHQSVKIYIFHSIIFNFAVLMAKFFISHCINKKKLYYGGFGMKAFFKLSPVIVLAALMMKGFDALLAAPLEFLLHCLLHGL